MGKLLTEAMGNCLTTLMGNYLTEGMGKLLDIYTPSAISSSMVTFVSWKADKNAL